VTYFPGKVGTSGALKAAPVAARPARPGFLARLADAFMAAQMRRAECEIAPFLERHDAELLAARQRLLFGMGAPPRR
jgi:hypothetical protein